MECCPTCGARHAGGPSCHRCRTDLRHVLAVERTAARHQRLVGDIDEIVRPVRFEGWQTTHAGEREVKQALRRTLFKYRLHQERELFDRAYGYIRQYY